jgi:hypothetical protein
VVGALHSCLTRPISIAQTKEESLHLLLGPEAVDSCTRSHSCILGCPEGGCGSRSKGTPCSNKPAASATVDAAATAAALSLSAEPLKLTLLLRSQAVRPSCWRRHPSAAS